MSASTESALRLAASRWTQTFVLQPGYGASGPANDPERKHLWIILTETCALGANLLVCVTSLRENQFFDPACIIEPNEHRRIPRRSWIEYRRCRAERSDTLIQGEAAWLYQTVEPISDALFERVCTGLLKSNYVPIRLKLYFEGKGPAF